MPGQYDTACLPTDMRDKDTTDDSSCGASLEDVFSDKQAAAVQSYVEANYVPREEYEREREQRKQAERERDELRDRVAELEDEQEDTSKRLDAASTHRDNIENEIAELSDTVERGGFVPDSSADPDPDSLPIEQMADLPSAVAEDALSQNDLRARWTWTNWESLSDRTRGGTVVKASDWMTAVRTAEGRPQIESKTRERVFKRLVSYTGGAVRTKKKDGEWRLFRPDNWREDVKDTAAWNDAPDSLAAGGAVSGVAD